MKRTKFKYISILSLVLILVACSNTSPSSTLSGNNSASSTLSENDSTSFPSINDTSLLLSNTDEFIQSDCLSGVGEQKLLVVPCQFEGEREFDEEMLERIQRGFFEDNLSSKQGETNYFSLKEYYYKSSLGNLTLTGEVYDVVDVPYTVSELEADGSYFPGVAAMVFQNQASDELLKEYDQDKDGYVDSVCFIYSSPTSERTGNFWAWVTMFATEANVNSPQCHKHMWAGIDSFSDNTYDIDTHTIIHESGHLLGLRDYYPTDNNEVVLGGHSMMDYNISDHDPYSKMLLGWCEPTYYQVSENEINVTLKPFQGTNEFILLNNSWNHSVMDEYIIIEYYTPTGLNEPDAKSKYQTRPLGFTKPGIKLYKADSRVAKCTYNATRSDVIFDSYVDSIPEDKEDYYYVIGASNSYQDSRTDASRKGRYKQISLIENKPYNLLQSGATADDDSLFYEGDVFNSSSSAYVTNGKYNNKDDVNLIIEVVSLSAEYATLKIKSIGGTL